MELIHVKIQLKIHTYRHVESGVAKAASAEVCESVCTHTHICTKFLSSRCRISFPFIGEVISQHTSETERQTVVQ